jgi:hypothetical protein
MREPFYDKYNRAVIVNPVWMPADLLANFALDRWNALSQEEREGVAAKFCDSLGERNYGFEGWGIDYHGPDREQPVLFLTETRTAMEFALIPGGTLLPGYDDAHMERFAEILDLKEGWRRKKVYASEQERQSAEEFFAEVTQKLRRKPPVNITPFLMAVFPVMAMTPGIQQVLASPGGSKRTWEEVARRRWPVSLKWESVPPVLQHFGWILPTTWEYEWAVKGGKEGLFFWGDKVPHFVADDFAYHEYDAEMRVFTAEQRHLIADDIYLDSVMMSAFSRSRPRIWPYCNRFGIVGPVARSHWCAPSKEPDDPTPLIVRGGGAEYWPWQGAEGWLTLLTAAEERLSYDAERGQWNILRPIIRLRPTAG